MFLLLQVTTAFLACVTFALSFAHALELPGKLRLDKETYCAVQTIYYPGFTIAGAVGEFGGLIATAILLLLTRHGTTAFWLTLIALLGLAGMQIVFWSVTQPVNQYWVQGKEMGKAGSQFFATGAGTSKTADWQQLRDRWERSHVIRAGLAMFSFVALLIRPS